MSLLPRTLRACTSASVSSAVSTSRAFSTTTARCGLTSEDVRNQSPKDLEYQFDDYTSDTWRRLKEIDGVRSLIAKVTTDKAALKCAHRSFGRGERERRSQWGHERGSEVEDEQAAGWPGGRARCVLLISLHMR